METLEEASARLAKIHCDVRVNTNTTEFQIQQLIIKGAKWLQEHYGLMEIELRHTKRLLASCEKALEERDGQQERIYSEKDMKQFAFECVGKFLSNDDNKVEIKLVDVIIDRLNKHFEQFKKK